MRLVKIAVASVNTTVGAVHSNVSRLVGTARSMEGENVGVACFPEQVVGGYPPEDLIQWGSFVEAQRRELDRFAEETGDLPTVFVIGLAVGVGAQLFNCAAVVYRGRILGFVPKEKLPTYHVFYEERTFSRGGAGLALDSDGVPLGDYLFEFDFGVLAVDICEDAWSPDGPFRRRCYSGAEIVANVSASPYRIGIASTRREMFSTRSADNQATFVHSNALGGQDGLVFDGGGFILQNGRMVLDAPRLREGWWSGVVDLDRTRYLRKENTTWRAESNLYRRREPVPVIRASEPTADRSGLEYPMPEGGSFFLPPAETVTTSPRDEVLDELTEVLALGVKDYYQKTGAFGSFGVALSGGRDSVLTLLIVHRAAQLLFPELEGEERHRKAAEKITCFYMPSRYSGDDTRKAAETLCEELGIELRTLAVDEAFDRELEATAEMLAGEAEADAITRQNVQARVRATRMWNWANTAGALFVQTGDMSEKAVGYTTIGGDLEGGLSVIANVPKTVVIALLDRIDRRFDLEGVRLCLETVPGPELADEQIAESELMPFPVLDACLHLYAGEKMAPDEVGRVLPALFPEHDAAELEAWAERFATLFTRSIYKWVQAPLSLHVGSLDLDRERALQLPVVQRNEWGHRGEE
jgi:NAD+ synthase (glutamine-hydrolysing)